MNKKYPLNSVLEPKELSNIFATLSSGGLKFCISPLAKTRITKYNVHEWLFGSIFIEGRPYLVNIRMIGNSSASSGTVARDNIDDPGGEARLCDEAGDMEASEGGLLCQLHHHGVAGGQGGTQLPGLHQQRKVPGNNLEWRILI